MVRPTFIHVGPGRSGTSWLHEMFLAHPDIAGARAKETLFFDSEYGNGYEWYEAQFPTVAAAVGEFSAVYYASVSTPERIAAYDPSMRLIISVRRPRDLLASYYRFGLRRGLDLPPLASALEMPFSLFMNSNYQARKRAGDLTDVDQVSLIESLQLDASIERFRAHFPDEQIHYLHFDQIHRAPEQTLASVFAFLGVDPSVRPIGFDEVVNPTLSPRSRLVGQALHIGSGVARRIGAQAILKRAHRSQTLKRVVFRSPASETETDPVADLRPADQAVLAEEEQRLIRRFPFLEEVWADDPASR